MGCCSSDEKEQSPISQPGEVFEFDYDPESGCVIPRRLASPEPELPPDPAFDTSVFSQAGGALPEETGAPEENLSLHRSNSLPLYTPRDSSPSLLSCRSTLNPTQSLPMCDGLDGASMADSFAFSVGSMRHTKTLTRDQMDYINSGQTSRDQINRLMEVEEIRRGEIYGAFFVTSKMLELARKHVVPTVRSVPNHSFTGKRAMTKAPATRFTDPNNMGAGSPLPAMCSNPVGNEKRDTHVVEPKDDLTNLSLARPTTNEMERFQLLELSGNSIQRYHKVDPYFSGTWDFLSDPKASKLLCGGQVMFGFVCSTYAKLKEEDVSFINTFCNLTGFPEGEEIANNTPVLSCLDPEAMKDFVFILVKTQFIVPGFDFKLINADLMTSVEYQKSCQPGPPKFWEDVTEPHTIRFSKTLVRFVYSVVVQLKIWEFNDPVFLQQFRHVDGIIPQKMILLERTKRDITKQDSTVKCKSVLLYYPVTGGTLVTNATVVVNKALPGWIAAIVNKFSSSGLQEAAETAELTREYICSKFGDNRPNPPPPAPQKK